MPKGYKFKPRWKKCPACANRFLPSGPERSRQSHCSKSCAQISNAMKGTGISGQRGKHRLRTGKIPGKDGYIRVLVGDHPWPRRYHYMFEHVKVMEAHLGRRISANETVHHRNGNRTDNRLKNLELIPRGQHMSLHRRQKD